jgi:hypothetical protein
MNLLISSLSYRFSLPIKAIKSSPARKRLTFRESKRPNEDTPMALQNSLDTDQLKSKMSPFQESQFKTKLNSFKAIDSVDSVNNILNKSESKRALNQFALDLNEEDNDIVYSKNHGTDYKSISSSASSSRYPPTSAQKNTQTNTKSVTSIIRNTLPHERSSSKNESDQTLASQTIQIKVHSPSKLSSFNMSGHVVNNSEVVARKKDELIANTVYPSKIQIQYADKPDRAQNNSPSFNGK